MYYIFFIAYIWNRAFATELLLISIEYDYKFVTVISLLCNLLNLNDLSLNVGVVLPGNCSVQSHPLKN